MSKIYQINKKSQHKNLESQKSNIIKSFARFHNLHQNLYDVNGEVTDQLKKSDNTFLETIVFKVTKILDPNPI